MTTVHFLECAFRPAIFVKPAAIALITVALAPVAHAELRRVVFYDDFSVGNSPEWAGRKPLVGEGTWQVDKGADKLGISQGVADTAQNRVGGGASINGRFANIGLWDRLELSYTTTVTKGKFGTTWSGVDLRVAGTERRIFTGASWGTAWGFEPINLINFGTTVLAPPDFTQDAEVFLSYEYETGHYEFRVRTAQQTASSSGSLTSYPAKQGPNYDTQMDFLAFDSIRINCGDSGDLALRKIKVELIIDDPVDFYDWVLFYNLSGFATDDTDGDGLSDGVEYALAGLDPTTADGSPGIVEGHTLRFRKSPFAVANGDVSYRLEMSTNLVEWEEVEADVNDDEQISLAIPPDATKRTFLRLRVEGDGW